MFTLHITERIRLKFPVGMNCIKSSLFLQETYTKFAICLIYIFLIRLKNYYFNNVYLVMQHA